MDSIPVWHKPVPRLQNPIFQLSYQSISPQESVESFPKWWSQREISAIYDVTQRQAQLTKRDLKSIFHYTVVGFLTLSQTVLVWGGMGGGGRRGTDLLSQKDCFEIVQQHLEVLHHCDYLHILCRRGSQDKSLPNVLLLVLIVLLEHITFLKFSSNPRFTKLGCRLEGRMKRRNAGSEHHNSLRLQPQKYTYQTLLPSWKSSWDVHRCYIDKCRTPSWSMIGKHLQSDRKADKPLMKKWLSDLMVSHDHRP